MDSNPAITPRRVQVGEMAHVRRVPLKAQTGRARFAYEIRYRDPDHRERVKTFARMLDAVNFAASIETDKQRDEYIDPKLGRATFGEWSAKWLASKSPSGASEVEVVSKTH